MEVFLIYFQSITFELRKCWAQKSEKYADTQTHTLVDSKKENWKTKRKRAKVSEKSPKRKMQKTRGKMNPMSQENVDGGFWEDNAKHVVLKECGLPSKGIVLACKGIQNPKARRGDDARSHLD